MKKNIFILLIIICALPYTFVHAKPLRVGVLLPLSGPVATFGTASQNAFDMAINNYPPDVQNRIEFIFEDTQYDPKKAISAFMKLRNQDKVDICYVWGTPPAISVAPLAEQYKLPLVALSGDPRVAAHKKFVIDTSSRIEDFSKITLSYLRKKGFKKIGIVKAETSYIEELLRGIQANLDSSEQLHIIQSFSPENVSDMAGVIQKVKKDVQNEKFDVIGVFLAPGGISSFYQKMAQYKIEVQTFGTDFFGDLDEMKKSLPKVSGSFYATIDTTDAFTKRYLEKYESTVQLAYVANTYDFVSLLIDITSRTPEELSSERLLTLLQFPGTRSGAQGLYKFIDEDPSAYTDPGKRISTQIVIKEIDANGKSVLKRETLD